MSPAPLHPLRRLQGRLLRAAAPLVVLLLTGSCASLARYPGVGRIKRYHIESELLPPAFDGARVAFATDFHYPSKLTPKRLRNAVAALQSTRPHLLLLGGDYLSDTARCDTLFALLAQVDAPLGRYGVMGNHDEAARPAIEAAMQRHGIVPAGGAVLPLACEGDTLWLCGVRHPFAPQAEPSPSLAVPPDKFTLLLTHTPDYADDTDIGGADLVLAGHTHGGQVTLFYLYAPVNHSKYGRKYLTGESRNRNGVPVIVSNGLGTSRRKVRFCAPSEVVLVTLHRPRHDTLQGVTGKSVVLVYHEE